MKYRRKHLLQIKRKYLKIIIPAVVVILLVGIIVLVSSHQRETTKKQAAVEDVFTCGVLHIGLRGDIGTLCTYNKESGVYEGLEKDIADEIVSRLFADGILVEYVNVSSETRDALLRKGDVDFALGAAEYQDIRGINYTAPYYSDGSAFLVEEGSMTSEAGLSGGTVAVVQDSYAAQDIGDDEEIMRIQAYLSAQGIDAAVRVYASYPEAVDALAAGFVDGVCAGEVFLKVFGRTGMLMLPERFLPVPMCIGVSGTRGAFSAAVDDALAAMKQDGTFDALIEKWNLIDYGILDTD